MGKTRRLIVLLRPHRKSTGYGGTATLQVREVLQRTSKHQKQTDCPRQMRSATLERSIPNAIVQTLKPKSKGSDSLRRKKKIDSWPRGDFYRECRYRLRDSECQLLAGATDSDQ